MPIVGGVQLGSAEFSWAYLCYGVVVGRGFERRIYMMSWSPESRYVRRFID
jgi:hypothetical protein